MKKLFSVCLEHHDVYEKFSYNGYRGDENGSEKWSNDEEKEAEDEDGQKEAGVRTGLFEGHTQNNLDLEMEAIKGNDQPDYVVKNIYFQQNIRAFNGSFFF